MPCPTRINIPNSHYPILTLFLAHTRPTMPRRLFAITLVLPLIGSKGVFAAANDELTGRSLDELLTLGLDKPSAEVRVTTAAKSGQSLASAPTVVRVITREDIRTFGYRTLGEALRSLPGLNISNDRTDVYLDARGYSPPLIFNTRALVLIDGERINESLYDSAYVGGEFPLDVDLIERIEYAPGPGSAIYGRNAMFGVVNVITRTGHSLNGGEASLEYGGFDTYKARGSYGQRFDNGVDLLVSGTGFDRAGPDRPPLFDVGRSWDTEQFHNVFGKLGYGAWRVEAGYNDRRKGLWYQATDHQTRLFLVGSFDDKIADNWGLFARLGYHRSTYAGDYPYYNQANTPYLYSEYSDGAWWDGELRLTYTGWERHRWLLGGELQHNFRSLLSAADSYFSEAATREYSLFLGGVYLQDEFELTDTLTLLAGVRHDHHPFGDGTNPRVGLTWRALDDTTVKFLWGNAYRPPNLYEQGGLPSPYPPDRHLGLGNLQSEAIDSFELTVEHAPTATTRLTTSLYHYHLHDVLSRGYPNTPSAFMYINAEHVTGRGMEITGEQRFENGARLNLSYTFQDVVEAFEERPPNSPTHMVKLHISLPLFDDHSRLGWENLYISDRRTYAAPAPDYGIVGGYGRVAGFLLSNLTVTTEPTRFVQFSAGVYNLFDRRYADPIANSEMAMPQDGVSFRLKLNLRF